MKPICPADFPWKDYKRYTYPLGLDLGPVSFLSGLTASTYDAATDQSASWGDYDNDGRMDLYLSAMSSKAGRRILTQIPDVDPRFSILAAGNALYRNAPNAFEKTSGASSPKIEVEQSGWDWGAQFVDLNNDGWLDIFSLSGFYTAPKQVETDFDI